MTPTEKIKEIKSILSFYVDGKLNMASLTDSLTLNPPDYATLRNDVLKIADFVLAPPTPRKNAREKFYEDLCNGRDGEWRHDDWVEEDE